MPPKYQLDGQNLKNKSFIHPRLLTTAHGPFEVFPVTIEGTVMRKNHLSKGHKSKTAPQYSRDSCGKVRYLESSWWLGSTPLQNISQIGFYDQVGVKMRKKTFKTTTQLCDVILFVLSKSQLTAIVLVGQYV